MLAKLRVGRILSFFLILSFVHTVSAGTPVWSFTPLTATTVSVPITGTATVQYKITNQSPKTHVLNMRSLPGVTQLTTGVGACSNPFTLTGNASCTLSLHVSGSELTSSISNGPLVCEQGSILQCYQPSPEDMLHVTTLPVTRAYVGDGSNTLWQCPIGSNGDFSGDCTAHTNSTAPGFIRTIFATPYTFLENTYLYVTTFRNEVWQCQINSSGEFDEACVALVDTITPNFTGFALQATFKIFSGTTYAYITNYSDIVWQCTMSSSGEFVGSCTALTNTSPFYRTQTLTFKTFSGVLYAYISDLSDTLWQCPMSETGDFAGECTALTNKNPAAFYKTINATFHTFSGTTYAYVADHSNILWQCPMNAAGTFADDCTALTNTTSLAFKRTINATFNTVNGVTSSYIGDLSTNIWQCTMTSTGGFNGGCTARENTTSPGFYETRGPTLY
jgi:hypothetical protein